MMKIILSFWILSVILLGLAACQSKTSDTKVRVVGLTYQKSEELSYKSKIPRLLKLTSERLLIDDDYIYVGQTLIFTIEIEDPNYEVVAILSVEFNGDVIRANVSTSSVTTRDCGANICVDFPYEVIENTTEYAVEDVKYSKVNQDNAVSAIIDNFSTNIVTINLYMGNVFPYVDEAVNMLNEIARNARYYQNPYNTFC